MRSSMCIDPPSPGLALAPADDSMLCDIDTLPRRQPGPAPAPTAATDKPDFRWQVDRTRGPWHGRRLARNRRK